MTGKEYGKLKVIERDYSKPPRKDVEHYRCECRCGNKNYITTAKELLSGERSCGCIRKKRGFNTYKIIGDTTILYFRNQLDEIVMSGLIDTNILDKLIKYNHSWHLIYDKKLKSYYAKCTETYFNEEGKRKQRTVYLHRFVLDYSGKHYVDHENHDTLDNQIHNLKIVDQSVNMKNGSGLRKNNSSGEPNVGWSNGEERWIVQFSVNKKNKVFGRFRINELDKAIVFAREMRQKLYKPDFVQEGYNMDNLMFIS